MQNKSILLLCLFTVVCFLNAQQVVNIAPGQNLTAVASPNSLTFFIIDATNFQQENPITGLDVTIEGCDGKLQVYMNACENATDSECQPSTTKYQSAAIANVNSTFQPTINSLSMCKADFCNSSLIYYYAVQSAEARDVVFKITFNTFSDGNKPASYDNAGSLKFQLSPETYWLSWEPAAVCTSFDDSMKCNDSTTIGNQTYTVYYTEGKDSGNMGTECGLSNAKVLATGIKDTKFYLNTVDSNKLFTFTVVMEADGHKVVYKPVSYFRESKKEPSDENQGGLGRVLLIIFLTFGITLTVASIIVVAVALTITVIVVMVKRNAPNSNFRTTIVEPTKELKAELLNAESTDSSAVAV